MKAGTQRRVWHRQGFLAAGVLLLGVLVLGGAVLYWFDPFYPQRGNSAVAFSPDGRWLAAGNYKSSAVRLWEIPQGQPFLTSSAGAEPVYAIAVSPDGCWIASGGNSARTGW